jgi:hypothetical protein
VGLSHRLRSPEQHHMTCPGVECERKILASHAGLHGDPAVDHGEWNHCAGERPCRCGIELASARRQGIVKVR